MKKIHLSKPDLSFSLKDINLSDKSVFQFEEVLESYLSDKKHVVALNSGTSAIHLALILAGVSNDDEVLCQSFTFVASANPIVYLGAKPVFIDSETDTWNLCPILLEKAILARIAKGIKPKAIIFVHLYGMPAKIEEITLVAKKYNIILIEDAAEALGSEYKGKKCGTFGDFGIISFNENKVVTTFGGGALICKNEEDKIRAIYLARQAKEKYNYYQHSEIGYNYRMDKISASVGLYRFKNIKQYILSRRKVHLFYINLFDSIKGVDVFNNFNENCFSNHWLSCILIDEKYLGFSRDDLIAQLDKDTIESRPLWKPMHLQPVFKECDYFGASVSENLFNNGLCLPSGANLTENDLERIGTSIKKFL